MTVRQRAERDVQQGPLEYDDQPSCAGERRSERFKEQSRQVRCRRTPAPVRWHQVAEGCCAASAPPARSAPALTTDQASATAGSVCQGSRRPRARTRGTVGHALPRHDASERQQVPGALGVAGAGERSGDARGLRVGVLSGQPAHTSAPPAAPAGVHGAHRVSLLPARLGLHGERGRQILPVAGPVQRSTMPHEDDQRWLSRPHAEQPPNLGRGTIEVCPAQSITLPTERTPGDGAVMEHGRCPCGGTYDTRSVEVRLRTADGEPIDMSRVPQGACPVCGSRSIKRSSSTCSRRCSTFLCSAEAAEAGQGRARCGQPAGC